MKSPKDDLLEELKIHRGHKNISSTLYDKLKVYIENGGNLDTDDWLFYIEYKFSDEQLLDIDKLQEERHSLITFDSKAVLNTLKNVGFFKIKNCPEEVLVDKQIKQRDFVEKSVIIALQDNSKAVLLDLEADVCKANSSYTEYLKDLGKLSTHIFKPIDIIESWESEEGPIKVTFTSNGNNYTVRPNYWDDWYDIADLNNKINQSLKARKVGFFTLTSGFTGGQEIFMLFLTYEEKSILEREFGWQIVEL